METRTHVARDHAMIGPDSHVVSPMTGWTDTDGVTLISPAMAGPRFAMSLVHTTARTRDAALPADRQRLIYVLEGELTIDGRERGVGSFVYRPPGDDAPIAGVGDGKLLVFDKPFVASEDGSSPTRIVGHVDDVPGEPFMGDEHARLQTLLPIDPAFDMAVNVFTFDPGTPLPLVETHVMEHGLYMAAGAGVYRLNDSWYPVRAGDAIWMASYCPQWFVAMGRQPATYIYYKDIHRDPLS